MIMGKFCDPSLLKKNHLEGFHFQSNYDESRNEYTQRNSRGGFKPCSFSPLFSQKDEPNLMRMIFQL